LMPEGLCVVKFDERAIDVVYSTGERRRVEWDEITRVRIRTTDEGPFLPDVFWAIHAGGDEPVVVFPGGASGESELLVELQRKLPGFNNNALIRAMTSTSNADFLLWPNVPMSGTSSVP
jgi:hypothetical protein